MKKRLLSLALVVAMLLSFGMMTTASAATADVAIAGGSVSTPLEVGATVDVPVSITTNPGLVNGRVTASWDNTALELTGVTYGNVMPNNGSPALTEGADTYSVTVGNALSADNYTGTGVLFTLTFEILSGASAKDYEIALTGEAGAFVDTDLGTHTPAFTNAVVTLTGGSSAAGTNYYWDFTDTTAVDGKVVSAVETDGWAANDLTYTGSAATVTANGANSTVGNYYAMATPVTLPADEAWTIEWGGKMSNASLVFSNNNNASGALPANAQHEHFWYDGTGIMRMRKANGSDAGGLTLNTKAYSGKDATWYITHDGTGYLTFAVKCGEDVLVGGKAKAITADYTIDSLMGVFTASNPFCYQGSMKYMKIYDEYVNFYAAEMNGVRYQTLADAFAAAETAAYPATPANATTIKLLADVESGFDVGVETGSTSTFQTQNIVLDLNGYTLTLGYPPVGSSDVLKTNGLRVLAFSELEIKNGDVAVDNSTVKIAMANYGTLTLTDVDVTADESVMYTINNRGDLTLAGATSVANGEADPQIAITNQPYNYPDAQNINAKLNVASADVVVGDVQVELSDVTQSQTGAVNAGVPEINISAGTFGKIFDDGETAKTPVGNITGGTFSAEVPEDLCAEGYIPADNGDGTYGVEAGTYVAEMNGKQYGSVSAALAEAEKTAYYDGAPANATTIKLLADTNDGFDIGVETGSLTTWKNQNIILDLNGNTLTLDQPVGSGAVKDNGLRVLANSELVIKNGTIKCADSGIDSVINNYGVLTLADVAVNAGDAVEVTVYNRGNLTLAGETTIANGEAGDKMAIINSPYDYPYDADINAVLNIADADVTVGKVLVKLAEVVQSQNGAVNAGVPEINISAGTIESIADDGETAKTPVGNITGGTFASEVPEDLCAEGYIPADNGDGTYGVEQGEYTVEMTVNGETTKYKTINEAIAAAPVASYAEGKAGESAELASIKLLADNVGGFDVGTETGSLSTWKIQNIAIDLNGNTLTLGQPLVGSTGTVTNGIRVLAYSQLTITNGTVSGLDSGALRGLQNYGAVVVEDVVFEEMADTYDTIGNFGSLELKGETVVPNGSDSAILNSTYLYSDDSQVPVTLTIADADVTVGKIVMNLAEYTHSQTGTVNKSNPELTIEAGTIEAISSTGSDKTLVGGVTGGTFASEVPEDLCAEGYIPADNGDGTYGVEVVVYAAEIDGVKYETLAEAIAAVQEDQTIVLLKDIDEEPIVVSKTICFFVDGNGFNVNAKETIVPGAGYTVYMSGSPYDEYLFVCDFSAIVSLPAPTTTLTVEADSGKPFLTWSEVEGADSYEIWRAIGVNGTYELLTTTDELELLDEDAQPGDPCYYKVRAMVEGVSGEFSTAKGYTCDLARPEASLTIEKESGKPELSWDEVDDADEYEIWRREGTGSYELYLTTDETEFFDEDAEAGVNYYYQVRALLDKSANATSAYSIALGITCDCARPVNVTATLSDAGSPIISWDEVDGAGRYYIYRSTEKWSGYELWTNTTGTSILNNKNYLEIGTTYYYQVVAVATRDSDGKNIVNSFGAYSTPVDVVCGGDVITALDQPVAEASVDEETGLPVISWDEVDDADRYYVFRATTRNGGYYYLANTDKLEVTDNTAEVGNTYYYKVRAVMVDENGEAIKDSYSPYSTIVSATCEEIVVGPLDAPNAVASTDSDTGLPVIEWDEVEGADRYYIFRAAKQNGTYSYLGYTTDTELLDEKALLGNTYWYMVRAVALDENGQPDPNSYSPYSEKLSATCTCARPEVEIALNGEGNPKLTWDKVEGAECYYIYRSTEKWSGYEYWTWTTNTSIVNDTDEVYYYQVEAVDTSSDEITHSAPSTPVRVD